MKPFWQSKTFWVNVVTLLIAIFGLTELQQWISPATILTIVSALNIVLRFITKDVVTFKNTQ